MGRRIREAMAAKGLDVKQLAEAVGIDERHIYYYCRGAHPPTTSMLILIAEALGERVGWFFDGQRLETLPPAAPPIREERTRVPGVFLMRYPGGNESYRARWRDEAGSLQSRNCRTLAEAR